MVTGARCVSRRGAAEYLGCSLRMVDKLRGDGRLPALRVGRRVVFDKRALERIIDEWAEPAGMAGQLVVALLRARQSGDVAGVEQYQRRLSEDFGVTVGFASDLGAAV